MRDDVLRWANRVTGPEWTWFVKYLAGNDTLLTGAHQAGPYVSRHMAFALFPDLADPHAANPRVVIPVRIESHGIERDVTLIWYNNTLRGGTRNECRITGWGGGSSPLLDPESTASLCAFAFHRGQDGAADACSLWLCRDEQEEDALLELTGPIEPGRGELLETTSRRGVVAAAEPRDLPCLLKRSDIPPAWLARFPSAAQIVEFVVNRLETARAQQPDARLLKRRECEYEVFRSVEDVLVLPAVRAGFASVDLFVNLANAVTNRRKARSGLSLELHARTIFDEEGLQYSHGAASEGNKRPDFLFPSVEAYRNPRLPADRLRMLAVKTTCKDRWRQILNEADRIRVKHLLTLQEGVSPTQMQEMRAAGVKLVVPKALHRKFGRAERNELIGLEEFVAQTRAMCSE